MSDLIERYGYERAVRELKAMDDRAIWMISSCLKYREEVREECLEYRREHNIFEVGDYVLRNDGFFSVLKITGIDNGCADLVRRVDGDPRWSRFNLTDIRHTTGEEIQAGRRL